MVTHTIRLDDESYQKIKTLSEKYDLTLSQIINILFDLKIDIKKG